MLEDKWILTPSFFVSVPEDPEVRKVWDFCAHRSKSVEIYYKNMDGDKILTRIHFQFDPVVSAHLMLQ